MLELHAFDGSIISSEMNPGFEIPHPIEPGWTRPVPTYYTSPPLPSTQKIKALHPPVYDAVKHIQEANEEVQTFTGGSGVNEDIGAARRRGQHDKIPRFHLGSMSHYTVYIGEQIGARSRVPYIGSKPAYI